MSSSKGIRANLAELDKKYLSSKHIREQQFYSKLSILELCGWIEEEFDAIFLSYGQRRLKTTATEFEGAIKKTYGFDYKSNIRPLLIKIIGLKGLERFETNYGQQNIDSLKSKLGTLKSVRDSYAHTHTKGVVLSVIAPSVNIGHLNQVLPLLIDLRKQLNRIR